MKQTPNKTKNIAFFFFGLTLVVAFGGYLLTNSGTGFKDLSEKAKAQSVSSSLSEGENLSSSSAQETSQLSEEEQLKKKVRENPDAGLEAVDPETLERTKGLMKYTPGFIIENELKSQLEDGYITQKQYDEFIELMSKIKAGEEV